VRATSPLQQDDVSSVRSASDAAASEDDAADYAAPRINMASFSDLAAVTGQTVTPTAATATAATAAATADSSADEPDYTHVAEQLLAPAGGGSPRGGWAPGASPSMRAQGTDKHRAHFAESFGDSDESEHEYSEDFEAVPSPVKVAAAVAQQQQQQQQYSSHSDSSSEQQQQQLQQTASVQDAFGRGVTQLTVARSDTSPQQQQQQQRADDANSSSSSHDYGADDTFESDSADNTAAATTAGTARGKVLEFADLDTVAVGSLASHISGASPVLHFTNSAASASTAATGATATTAAGTAAGAATSAAYRRTSAAQTQQHQQQQPSLLLSHSAAAAAASLVPLGSASTASTTAAAGGARSSRSVAGISQQQQQQRTARGVLLERSRDAVIEEPIHKVRYHSFSHIQ
jgi:trimeric autotransporter adhesin